MRPRLKQLAQSGASDEQIVKYDGTTDNQWEPADLIDVVASTIHITDFFATDETSPDAGTMSGVPTQDFAVDEELEFTVGVPDGWDGVSDLTIKVLYAMSTASASKTVRLATEGYIVDESGNDVDTLSATNYDLSPGSSANAPDRSATIRTIAAASLGIGDHVALKIARRDAPSDEHGGDFRLVEVTASLDVEAGNTTDLPLPYNYVDDLELSYNTAAQVQIGAGRCRADDNITNMVVTSTITVDITSSGANGLDTGSEANSTWYYVWLIKNTSSGTLAGMLSTSSTSPTMPSGYTKKRRIGVAYNDSSGDLFDFQQHGHGKDRIYDWIMPRSDVQIASSLNATSYTNVTVSYMPATTEYVHLCFRVTGDGARVRPDGTSIGEKFPLREETSVAFWMTAPGQTIEYKVDTSGGSFSCHVLGFQDHI